MEKSLLYALYSEAETEKDYKEIKDHYEKIISADRLLHYIRVIIGVENKNCKNIKAWMVSNSPGT